MPTDVDLLAFEQRWFRYAGAKAAAIREELGISETRYWQLLVDALRAPSPEAATRFGPVLRRLERQLRVAGRLKRPAA